ncbi:hypothetical protein EVC62_02120 [Salinicola endophyticus]|uniref:Tip attachment protein J domain-containing protein n=1 Tax=Salinicola endophyticus TaxID=1949083 RepID=A0ABY8FEB9_9GAMM|nr:hypothetical protein [Salinicola endophyticus]WFF40390.1 hypothetical protein EVC62_02120 [Salinicola endophyticus]
MIEWPQGLTPYRMDWGRVYNNRAFTSPFSNAQQIRTYPGAYWQCSLQFRNLFESDERRLTSFIGRLQGMAGTFKLYPWRRSRAGAAGTARVNGSGNASGTVPSRGWTPSVQVLAAGDYITINDQLLEVVEDVISTSQGNATIQVSPWLRSPPADGALIEYRNPYAVMRLASDEQVMSVETLVAGGTLDCREAF